MSWGLQFKAEIFIPRVRKTDVENKIKENEEYIGFLEKEMLMLSISNPRDIASKENIESGEIVHEIHVRVEELFYNYKETLQETQLLYIALENINDILDC